LTFDSKVSVVVDSVVTSPPHWSFTAASGVALELVERLHDTPLLPLSCVVR
jgi:hypothetical protein